MRLFNRIVLTAILLSVWSLVVFGINTEAALVVGQSAGAQLLPSDGAYRAAMSTIRATTLINSAISLIGIVMLVLLWRKPVQKMHRSTKRLITSIAAVIVLLTLVPPTQAYYDKSDYVEPYYILPNESAFYVPDVGDNKNSQVKFGSLEYYEANKIASKRFIMPHVKLENSGALSNYYVNAGRLILVDRTPQSREWVNDEGRGTSKKQEGFKCQSKEGLDITVGITIGVSVTEEQAPKFLYRFGVTNPKGDRSKPEIIFTSVYYGRSLAEVTDGPVRNKVQALICDEFTTKSLDEANAGARAIITASEVKIKTYLDGFGVTLDFMGWADTFEFNTKVQDVINRKYVADKEAMIAASLAPHASTLQALATAEATRTVATGFSTGKIQLPTSLSIMDFGWLKDLFSSAAKPAK